MAAARAALAPEPRRRSCRRGVGRAGRAAHRWCAPRRWWCCSEPGRWRIGTGMLPGGSSGLAHPGASAEPSHAGVATRRPAPSPPPGTPTPRASAAPVATAAPPTPVATAAPRFGTAANVDRLTAWVPSSVRAGCVSEQIGSPVLLAALRCKAPGAKSLRYLLYSSAATVTSYWNAFVAAHVPRSGGSCAAGEPAAGTWNDEGLLGFFGDPPRVGRLHGPGRRRAGRLDHGGRPHLGHAVARRPGSRSRVCDLVGGHVQPAPGATLTRAATGCRTGLALAGREEPGRWRSCFPRVNQRGGRHCLGPGVTIPAIRAVRALAGASAADTLRRCRKDHDAGRPRRLYPKRLRPRRRHPRRRHPRCNLPSRASPWSRAVLATRLGPLHAAAIEAGIVALELRTTDDAFVASVERRTGRPTVPASGPGASAPARAHLAALEHAVAAVPRRRRRWPRPARDP